MNVLGESLKRPDGPQCVGINDLTEPRLLAGVFRAQQRDCCDVSYDASGMIVNGCRIPITKERDPARLNWGQYGNGVIVVESTGVFRTREGCSKHLAGGAARVLLTVPPDDEVDFMMVMGVNDEKLSSNHQIVSNASCTTNSIGYPVRVLNEKFAIKMGLLTTVHAATNDQRVVDMVHSDLRRARTVFGNIIPTTTGAARAIGKVYDPLKGRLNGGAVRVAAQQGSLSVLDLMFDREVTIAEINQALVEASAARPSLMTVLDGDLDEPVLFDIVGSPQSAIIDAKRTMVVTADGCSMVQVYSWYDNVIGYCNRCVDLLQIMGAW